MKLAGAERTAPGAVGDGVAGGSGAVPGISSTPGVVPVLGESKKRETLNLMKGSEGWALTK